MKISEIIRAVLDVIDQAETGREIAQPKINDISQEDFYNDDVRRFRQIVDLQASGEETEYSNTPREEYAGLDAVTTAAGGGPNKPKHVDDIRGNSWRVHGGN
jgi:hypothetical protein